jgi:hypothetical protein
MPPVAPVAPRIVFAPMTIPFAILALEALPMDTELFALLLPEEGPMDTALVAVDTPAALPIATEFAPWAAWPALAPIFTSVLPTAQVAPGVVQYR